MDIPLIGQIKLFPYGSTPTGWTPCNGNKLPIPENAALYSLLGTRFGGDGVHDFAVPDLREKSPSDGTAYYIAVFGLYPSRE